MNTPNRVHSQRESHMNGKSSYLKAAGLLLGGLALSGAASAATVPVRGNVPPVVAKATFVSHHSPTAVLTIDVALPLRNTGELNDRLHHLQDRSSPYFHQFLTSAQFKASYGPMDADVANLKAFLTQRGIKVLGVSGSNTRVYARGTTAALESAFGVAINNYSYNGTTFYSASGNPQVPSNLKVSSVMGLEDAVQLKPHLVQGPTPKGAGLGPAGFMPRNIATAYDWPDITNPANGAGVTIGIVTAFSFRPLDLVKFWAADNLPAHNATNGNPITNMHEVMGLTTLSTTVLNGETTLDIERSSSMAPGAGVDVYEAVNPQFVNFDVVFQQAADDDLVQVISTSWGAPEFENPPSTLAAEHGTFQQLASEGIVVMAAAGDNGAADGSGANGGDNADFPSSDPYVIAAGGTTLTLDGSNNIIDESAWSGAGGADSLLFAEPAFQNVTAGWVSNAACADDFTGLFPDDTIDTPNEPGDGCTGAGNASRQSSDMAMDANPATPYAIFFNGRWVSGFGGTSFVAPQLAGLFANLVQQYGSNLPVPGPELVFCVGNGVNSGSDFHDITSGSNGFAAGTGWDHPTGFGSPDAANFITDAISECLPP